MILKFKSTPRKIGGSYHVVIPSDYIKNYRLDKSKVYEFTIEVKEDKVV